MSRSSPCESKTKTKQSLCEWSRFAARNSADGRLGMLLIFYHPIYLVRRSTRSARPFDCDARPCRSQAQETFPPTDWHPDSCHRACSNLEDSICLFWHCTNRSYRSPVLGWKSLLLIIIAEPRRLFVIQYWSISVKPSFSACNVLEQISIVIQRINTRTYFIRTLLTPSSESRFWSDSSPMSDIEI